MSTVSSFASDDDEQLASVLCSVKTKNEVTTSSYGIYAIFLRKSTKTDLFLLECLLNPAPLTRL